METLWFCLLAFMLATYLVLDGFDFGVGILHLLVAKNEPERQQVLRTIGPVWDGNEVWLLALGGTMFLAFPKLLATAFAGFYLPLMIVLWLLMFRALGIELRHQINSPLWAQFWDVAFSIASLLLAVVIGAALGNVVRGVSLNEDGIFFAPLWTDFRVSGRTGILDWFTILYGVATAIALAHHGAVWLAGRTDQRVLARSQRTAHGLWPLVLVLTIVVVAATYWVQPNARQSIVDRPWSLVLVVIAIAGLLGARFFVARQQHHRAFVASSIYLYGMMACGASWIFPYVLPSQGDSSGLTAAGAASSTYALTSALYWWIPGMLLVVGYTTYVYRSMPDQFSVRLGSERH
jgi:cytochrome d ubiquinol oxidase subunit II